MLKIRIQDNALLPVPLLRPSSFPHAGEGGEHNEPGEGYLPNSIRTEI